MQDQFRGGAAFTRRQFVAVAEATVSPLDWAFTRSDVVYDVVHVFEDGFLRVRRRVPRNVWPLWNVDAQSDRRRRNGGALMDRQRSAGYSEVRRMSGYGTAA
jgi:hypothetical protein